MTCWEEIRRSHLHESPNPMGQLGVVITQHHWAEVFLEEVNGQGGRTLLVNGHVFVTKASHTVILDSAVVNINSLERDGLRQAELCPRHTMKMKTKNTLIPDRSQPGQPFWEQVPTVQTQISCHRTRHLYKVYTVFLQECLCRLRINMETTRE